jgi:putative transposase
VSWAIQEKSYSQRKACALVGLEPKTFRYISTRPDDEPIRCRLRDLASQRRRFGYRRLGLLLGREGIRLNHKKLYRLYREERLMVRCEIISRSCFCHKSGDNSGDSVDFLREGLQGSMR